MRYQFCKVRQKVVPAHEVLHEVHESQLANIKHGYISDDMKPTRHPVDGKYYTSKSTFRAITKAHGFEEVGTAYDNGYAPEKDLDREWKGFMQGIKDEYKERLS